MIHGGLWTCPCRHPLSVGVLGQYSEFQPVHVEPRSVGTEKLVEALQEQLVPDAHPLDRIDPQPSLRGLGSLHLGLHRERGPYERSVDERPDGVGLCAAVFVAGGRSQLVRAKLRVGGLLLGLTAVAATGCEPQPMCYDTGRPVDDCSDSYDNDGDGWTDTADPDCDADSEETGYGSTACNDGMDDDGDGLEDAEDPGCADGFDDDESS